MKEKEKTSPSLAEVPKDKSTLDVHTSAKVENFPETAKTLQENYNPLDKIRAELDADAEEAAKAGERADTRENRFKAFMARGWFDDLDESITRPNFRFNIMGVDCVPSGEIVGIAGKPGAGKSTTLAILIGILIGRTEFAGIRCLTPCKKILWVDTEKGAYSCQQKMRNFRRVANVGKTETLTDIGIYFAMMRQVSTADRLFFISELAKMDKYDAIVIDGIFDLTENPNEDYSGVIDLQRQLADNGATVFAMLHTNKADGDNNMRYALGTEEQRIITTRFLIYYDDKSKHHVIKMDKSNDSALAPEVSFMFDSDGQVIPLTQRREIDVKQILNWVFRDGQPRDWNKLRADFRAKSGVSASEAFDFCQQAQRDNLIITELDGNLSLNKDYF